MNDFMYSMHIKLVMMREKIGGFLASERGVTAIEYAVVVAGVASVVMFVFGKDGAVSGLLTETFETLTDRVKDAIEASNKPEASS